MGRRRGSRPGSWKSSVQLQGSRQLVLGDRGHMRPPQLTTFPRTQPCCPAASPAKLVSKTSLIQFFPVLCSSTDSVGNLMSWGVTVTFTNQTVINVSLKHSPDPGFVSCSQMSLTPHFPPLPLDLTVPLLLGLGPSALRDRLWATTQGWESASEMGQSHSQGTAKIPSAPILRTWNSPEVYPVWRKRQDKKEKTRPHPPRSHTWVHIAGGLKSCIPGGNPPGNKGSRPFFPRVIRHCLQPHPTPLSTQGELIPTCQNFLGFKTQSPTS